MINHWNVSGVLFIKFIIISEASITTQIFLTVTWPVMNFRAYDSASTNGTLLILNA